MATSGFDTTGLAHLDAAMVDHVDQGSVGAAAWAVARHGEVHHGAAGALGPDAAPLGADSIFRISSMTKPVVAAAALAMAEDGRFALDDAVDRWLPELADRQVLVPGAASLADTVPAERPITVRDLLTFRMGLGMDFTGGGSPLVFGALVEGGLVPGPPAPATMPDADELLRVLGSVPLEHQPGSRWLYHTSAEVLGVLLARVEGYPLGHVLQERVFDPLGMFDTGFWVPVAALDRVGPCTQADPETGEVGVYDQADGQWAAPPPFESGGAGLVSTTTDFLAFARILLDGGVGPDGVRILSAASVDAMTTNQLTPEQRAAGPDPSGAVGWGFCLGVLVERDDRPHAVGAYGWDGGMGTIWGNDPAEGLVSILFTDRMWASPERPPICVDFTAAVYAARAA